MLILPYQNNNPMGRKKKSRPPLESLLNDICRMMVPAHILSDFEVYGSEEYSEYYQIDLREKEGKIPPALSGADDVVLDGYCKPVDILPQIACKPIYLRLYRRRYRRKSISSHFSNDYDLSYEGLKITPELGAFLKEEDRRISGEYSNGSPPV